LNNFTPGQHYSGYCDFTFKNISLSNNTPINIKGNLILFDISVPGLNKMRAQSTISTIALPDRCLNIEVIEDGIYKLSGKQLRISGIPVNTIPIENYRLFFKDKEVPLYISDGAMKFLSDNDYILFYGKRLYGKNSSFEQFSNTSHYRLFWGQDRGLRVAMVSGDRRKDPTIYSTTRTLTATEIIDTLHIEADNSIRWLGNISDIPPDVVTGVTQSSDEIDNWYWGIIGDKDLTAYTLTVPSPSQSGTAQLRISLMGLTSIDSLTPDHTFDLYLNGNPVGNNSLISWDGQRSFIFESDTFPSATLQHGNNSISFISKNIGITDRIALNWVECIYPYTFKALNGKARFKNSPKSDCKLVEYEIAGFTSNDIELWDIDRGRFFVNNIIRNGNGKERGTYTLVFQDSICNTAHYIAQEVQHRQVPNMHLDTLHFDRSLLKNADYIVIAPDSFFNDLKPLLDVHNNRGLHTIFVNIEKIYHYFSYGIHDPDAIRTFIEFCFEENKDHPPKYLLLAGDTSHDLDKGNKNLNLVPTHLSRITGWGPGADDGYFTTVIGLDQYPDLSIGRFPARNRSDIKCLVDKTCKYISSPQRGYWKDNILLLGGGEKEFTHFNDMISDEVIGSRLNTIRMDAEPSSRYYKDASFAPEMIANAINSGVFYINFNGHGGGNIWSDNNFFGYRDLTKLLNSSGNRGGRLPIIFSFTCLTGFFESVQYRSLGEEFLRNSQNGAVAFYGASAYTSRNGNMILNRMMLENALSNSYQTIGELITHCELNLLTQYDAQYLTLIKQYNLLGDPALPLLYPDTSLRLLVNKTILRGSDSLQITGQSTTVKSGDVRLLISSGVDEWNTRFSKTTDGSFSEVCKIKSQAHTANGIVRAYMWNDSAETRAVATFSKDTINISDISIIPNEPHYGDSVIVECSVPSDSEIEVVCLYSQYSQNETPTLNMSPMFQTPKGYWQTTSKIPVIFRGITDEKLGLTFRIMTMSETRESKLYSYKIADCPDLSFTTNKLSLYWEKDSLKTKVQVINNGSGPDSLFSVLLLTGEGTGVLDTFSRYESRNKLNPASIINISFSLPDTCQSLVYAVIIISTTRESNTENNRIEGSAHICKRILSYSSDTLYTTGHGIGIHPLYNLITPITLFIFTDTIQDSTPLKSSSHWVALGNDSIVSATVGCRPTLTPGDTLQWLFYPEQLAQVSDQSGSLSVMYFDSTLLRWRSIGQKGTPSQTFIYNNSTNYGKFAAAYIEDLRKPDVSINVYGRALNFIDYTAKDKPFSIFISDPSEIDPSTILLYHNNKLLSQDKYSQITTSGDLEHISVTVYPTQESSLDSLTVKASDLAGNFTDRTFPYLPGKDLSIQFFTCHPNPFTAAIRQDGTMTTIRFAFMLTDAANDVQLTIYTVTGRPIKTWKFSNLIGYQEISWDGRDLDGYRIANGTYYAKLTVKNKSKKLKKLIKIAKLEGY
jgi:hypothetical protein